MYNIEKLKTESLRTQVYIKLKEQLLRGVWKEGEKLPAEHALCALFGVSRVTVRGALQQLEILGLVETKQGGGTFVKNFSSIEGVDTFHPVMQIQRNQDLITILEYRKIIEKGSAGMAQERVTPEDIASLEGIYQIMMDTVEDLKTFSEADLAFHYRIAEITRNPIIIKVYGLITEMLSVAMEDIVRQLGRRDGLTYHRALIDALKKGDKAKTESIMEEHIEVTIKRIQESDEFEEDALWSGSL
ncbi:putative GntR domain protein [Treponema primitia ZAS-2]|uniref:Putative GntR domain protein n=1 Tax=Treponema primitia (strain ATCC BAA-887 / DSM 12427 / ZAS-2) TaxID=545694 RepID=F5YQW7_TREPZ|nr:FadR/GntR family transcriptional regulator [Treponema primitia]AEF85644.1 putative GntR domain protein [Treponema primitia ZAS-2]